MPVRKGFKMTQKRKITFEIETLDKEHCGLRCNLSQGSIWPSHCYRGLKFEKRKKDHIGYLRTKKCLKNEFIIEA